jgi:excisionase family DNA binding protein
MDGNEAPPRLYTCVELASLLGVGEDWIRRRVQDRSIPHVRLGRRVCFTVAHVEMIIAAATVEPLPPRVPDRRGSARTRL